MPVRGGLRAFGVDPKFAPFVVILITILLGLFVSQLVVTASIDACRSDRKRSKWSFVRLIGFIITA